MITKDIAFAHKEGFEVSSGLLSRFECQEQFDRMRSNPVNLVFLRVNKFTEVSVRVKSVTIKRCLS